MKTNATSIRRNVETNTTSRLRNVDIPAIAKCTDQRPVGQLEQSLATMSTALDQLDASIERLSLRLDPILVNHVCNDNGSDDKAPPPNRCAIATNITNFRVRIEIAQAQIEGLLSQIDL